MTAEEDQQQPHDVLAAEEFVVPAPDPLLQHEPLQVPLDPEDPQGQLPPHDVLAGEEFPIPAPPPRGAEPDRAQGSRRARLPALSKRAASGVAVLLVGVVGVLRRRRRG